MLGVFAAFFVVTLPIPFIISAAEQKPLSESIHLHLLGFGILVAICTLGIFAGLVEPHVRAIRERDRSISYLLLNAADGFCWFLVVLGVAGLMGWETAFYVFGKPDRFWWAFVFAIAFLVCVHSDWWSSQK